MVSRYDVIPRVKPDTDTIFSNSVKSIFNSSKSWMQNKSKIKTHGRSRYW